jgi:hypothetical protein
MLTEGAVRAADKRAQFCPGLALSWRAADRRKTKPFTAILEKPGLAGL